MGPLPDRRNVDLVGPMQMRLLLAATIVASAAGAQPLLARTYSQQLAVGPAFLQEVRADGTTSTSLTGAPTCDTTLSDPICFAGQRRALLPNAVPGGLIGHWDFNSEGALDSSGNGNHGVTEVVHGPAPVGSGHSAVFSKTFMMVPPSPLLNSITDFTYSFWVYLLDDGAAPASVGRSATWCPLIRKGISEAKTEQFASAPTLLFNHRTGHMRAEITTSVNNLED